MVKLEYNRLTSIQRRVLVIALGDRCSCREKDCWHTGSCSVSDPRCLHLDHINGDGAADRKRLGISPLPNYYLDHLDEARNKLQVLCSNCNWVKRIRNGEVRGDAKPTHEQSIVAESLVRLPEYKELWIRYKLLYEQATEYAEVDALDTLASWGVSESGGKSLVYHLTYNWCRQRFYSHSPDDLSGFLAEKLHILSGTEVILKRRIGGRGLSVCKLHNSVFEEGIANA